MLPNYHILNIIPVPYDSTHDYRIKIKSERFKHSILIDLNISESNSSKQGTFLITDTFKPLKGK